MHTGPLHKLPATGLGVVGTEKVLEVLTQKTREMPVYKKQTNTNTEPKQKKEHKKTTQPRNRNRAYIQPVQLTAHSTHHTIKAIDII